MTSEVQPSAKTLDGELLGRLDRRRPGLLVGSLASGALVLVFLYCWGYQITNGIGVTGINRPVFWGFYIINFVFWIGISHAGTLISAILRVTKAEWRRPVTRSAEAITLFALAIGGLFPLIHLGRVTIFYYMIPYPNSRMLWPNFRSPLVWDIAAITTYIIGSALYLFLPLIPDAAVMRDRAAAGLKKRFYAVLALGWRGTSQQWHSLEWGIRILAVAIIPVAVSVHTIVSWDFAMTQTPGWKSTIFGPYFVVGAIFSGIAVLMIAMALLRRGLALERFLTDRVFNNLGLLFVTMSLVWGYFTFAEHLTVWYSGDLFEKNVHHVLLHGDFAVPFWTMVVVNLVIPVAVLSFPRGRRPLPTALVGCGVLVGMWLERFLIVVPALSTPRLAYSIGDYMPSWVELGIMIGAIGVFACLYFTFTQLLPIVSVWEMREGWRHPGSGGTSGRAAAAAQTSPATSPVAGGGAA